VVGQVLRALTGSAIALGEQVEPLCDEGTLVALTEYRRLIERPELTEPTALGDWAAGALATVDSTAANRPALVEVPARPVRDERFREVPGYVCKSLHDDMGNLGEFLHNVALGVELCASEACAAMLGFDVAAVWDLRFDLARQVRDEARHFLLLSKRAEALGTPRGAYPAEYIVWDRFALGRSLDERLMIEQRIGETTGVDGGALPQERLEAAGDLITARIFDFINADEVTHVRTANHWLPTLLGDRESVDDFESHTREWLTSQHLTLPGPLPPQHDYRTLAGYGPSAVARDHAEDQPQE
jgi:uncharacterized ferritin-like protein (DUF455 family)